VNVLQLSLDALDAFLVFLSLQKHVIQLAFELFILSLNMDISIFDIFRSRIDSDLIYSKIIVGELSFQVPDLFAQLLVFRFKLVVQMLLLRYILTSLLEVLDLTKNQL
jgi:hypothetical protein